MPKYTLTFDLPEESEEHKHAINGQKYYCILQEISNEIRQKLKHGEVSRETESALEEIRNLILGEMNDDN